MPYPGYHDEKSRDMKVIPKLANLNLFREQSYGDTNCKNMLILTEILEWKNVTASY